MCLRPFFRMAYAPLRLCFRRDDAFYRAGVSAHASARHLFEGDVRQRPDEMLLRFP
jgi:hypothetical protein